MIRDSAEGSASATAQPGATRRRCPACGQTTAQSLGQKNGFDILGCRRCGTLYTACLPASSGVMDYDDYYGPANLSAPDFVQHQIDRIVGGFARYRRTGRFLDVGFGAGLLLEAAGRAGWDAEGVEVSRPAVEHAAGLGLKVFHGELAEARYPDACFDVVAAVEILEHVADPRALVEEIARILRPGGLFWATTPHSRGLSARLLKTNWSVVSPPEHLQLFSVKGLRGLLAPPRFRQVRTATHGVNPFEILNALGRRQRPEAKGAGFDRVATSYQLNQILTERPSRRALKNVLNGALSASGLGDSLKVWAVA